MIAFRVMLPLVGRNHRGIGHHIIHVRRSIVPGIDVRSPESARALSANTFGTGVFGESAQVYGNVNS